MHITHTPKKTHTHTFKHTCTQKTQTHTEFIAHSFYFHQPLLYIQMTLASEYFIVSFSDWKWDLFPIFTEEGK